MVDFEREFVIIFVLRDIGMRIGRMKTWVIVMVMYAAPPTAVDWPGPWNKGMVVAGNSFYSTEGECRNEAVKWIGRAWGRHAGSR